MKVVKDFLANFLQVEANISTYNGQENLDLYNKSVDTMSEMIVEELKSTLAVNIRSFEKNGMALKMILERRPNYLEEKKERADNFPKIPKRIIFKIEAYTDPQSSKIYAIYLSEKPLGNISYDSNEEYIPNLKESSDLILIGYQESNLKVLATYSYSNRGSEENKKYYSTGGLDDYSIKEEFWQLEHTKLGEKVSSEDNSNTYIPKNIRNLKN